MSFRHKLPLAVLALTLSACSLLQAPHARGTAALKAGDYQTAIEAFGKAIDAGDHVIIALINRGIAYESSGQPERAVEDYSRALENTEPAPTDTQRAEIHNNRGVAYLSIDRKQQAAMDDFDKAIELRPDYAEAYANRGKIKIDREEYDGAIVDFDKAIELKPDLAEAYGNRGLAYQNLGDDENATRDYTKAIELGHAPQAYWNRGMLRYALGCFNLAYEDFSAILKLAQPTDLLYFQAESQKLFLEGRPKNETSCRGIEGQLADDEPTEDLPGDGATEEGDLTETTTTPSNAAASDEAVEGATDEAAMDTDAATDGTPTSPSSQP